MTTLADLVTDGGIQTGPFGSQLHASDYSASGVGVVMPQDLGENCIDTSQLAYVSQEIADELSRHRLHTGDIVYSRRGDITRRAYVSEADGRLLCGTGCLRVRIEPGVADARFVSYAVATPDARTWLTQHAVGATMLNLNTSILGALPITVPDLPTQRAIAQVLGALDDKIIANRRVVAAADRLRVAIWERIIGQSNNHVPLASLARFVNGKAFTKNATGTGRIVIRIAELNSGIGGSTIWNDIDVDSDNVAEPGSYLMAWSGSLTARRWFRDEAIVNQHIFKVIPIGENPLWAVACAVENQMPFFRSIAADKATTMGHIQRRHLDEPVRWPAELPSFDQLSRGQALWGRALAAERESEVLARTRDELLPLLMNGKITIKQAEAHAEEVL